MKKVVALFFILYLQLSFAQENQPWASHFSYTNIVDVSQSNNRVYAGAENALFSKSLLTDELKTITSVDGLKTETVSAIYYSPVYNKTFVGNTNGLLLVVNPDNTVLNVVDIIAETTVQPTKKKINHIFENQGKLYVSCDFGIVVFNLDTMQFGDTFFLGPQGAEIPVLQAAVFNGFIYAATPLNGIRRALLSNPFLNDFGQWTEDTPGQWAGVTSFNNMLFAANTTGTLYRNINGSFSIITQMPSGILDLREANGYLTVTSRERVNVYNAQLNSVLQFSANQDVNSFTCATVVTEKIFIGTNNNGVFSANLANAFSFENITPNGPQRSNIFTIQKTPNFLWAVYGDYDNNYNPYPLDEYGISKLSPTGWITIPYQDIFNAKSVVDIIENPNNENQVYAASYFSGLVKIEGDVPQILYNETNTGQDGLQSLVLSNDPGYRDVRINALAYDKNGNLWMTNNRIESPLKVLKAGGGWASYDFTGVAQRLTEEDFITMVIDNNNTKWIGSAYNGLIGFNETLNNKYITVNEQNGNLPPLSKVQALVIDNNNQLWIGTNRGLRILQGTDRFLNENTLTTNPIIIEEEGVAQELMYEQSITDLVVDGANNKWIATGSAGAFLVSPDGQRTIFHFTQQNSPLPSNNVNDIEIDNKTGEVFFATNRGMVSYKGTSTGAADDLSKVYVYPNPVRPGFEGEVKISGLIDNANIKITDIEGNLVYETTSVGGTVLWDTKAFGKHKVASGVYMIFIVSDDGAQTKVKKVMIVR